MGVGLAGENPARNTPADTLALLGGQGWSARPRLVMSACPEFDCLARIACRGERGSRFLMFIAFLLEDTRLLCRLIQAIM